MSELNIPLIEKLKSIPETFGIRFNEEINYTVLEKNGDFEVRHYPVHILARITVRGVSFDMFREIAFKRLATYIFDDKNHEQIPMTSPVLEQQDHYGSWSMAFILPKEYTLQSAPKPKDPQIMIEEVPAHDVAVNSYSGNNTFEKIEIHKKELSNWLGTKPTLHTNGQFYIAQYDAPFVIPFFKKNEIHVKLDMLH